MKLSLATSLLVLFVSFFQVNSQDAYHPFRSSAVLELANSRTQGSCGENCVQTSGNRSLQDTETSGSTGSSDGNGSSGNIVSAISDVVGEHIGNVYKNLADQAQEQAKSTWDSLSSGAKAGIIIAIVVVAIIIIAGIIHCLCICKLCCCC
ncbi:hypothetical protein OIY81_2932 [Cryptosporidium canis]|nr:hypothetical protein OIY81_2932 [Cryptosporidium canis]